MTVTTKLRVCIIHDDEGEQTTNECTCSWNKIPDQIEVKKRFEELLASFYGVILK